eukprot:762557-Rhodomonas_salina.3
MRFLVLDFGVYQDCFRHYEASMHGAIPIIVAPAEEVLICPEITSEIRFQSSRYKSTDAVASQACFESRSMESAVVRAGQCPGLTLTSANSKAFRFAPQLVADTRVVFGAKSRFHVFDFAFQCEIICKKASFWPTDGWCACNGKGRRQLQSSRSALSVSAQAAAAVLCSVTVLN